MELEHGIGETVTDETRKKMSLGTLFIVISAIAIFTHAAIWLTGFPLHASAGDSTAGNVLAGPFVPIAGSGRALAFDGSKLYATYWGSLSTLRIISTVGMYERAIPIALQSGTSVQCGSLSWDGTQLWCGSMGLSDSKVYTVDHSTGLATFRFKAPVAWGESCFANWRGNLDGLEYNTFESPGSIWTSDDAARKIYHTTALGSVLYVMSAPYATIDGVTYECNTGIEFDGAHLWLALYPKPPTDPSALPNAIAQSRITQFTTTGVFTGISFVTGEVKEDLAYDTITFAPKCAIWALNSATPSSAKGHLHAYEVPCSGKEPVSKGPIATIVTLASLPNPSRIGELITISGKLVDQNGSGVSGRPIELETSLDGLNWQLRLTVLTGADGSFSVTSTGTTAGKFLLRAVFEGDETYAASTSQVLTHEIQ